MKRPIILFKKFTILCHRWMGVVFCLLFAWWFVSGIFMMYWDYPGVKPADRLERSSAIDASKIRISPREAWEKLGLDRPPGGIQLAMFDGRPLYTFTQDSGGRGGRRVGREKRDGGAASRVYADDGTIQETCCSAEKLLRIAAGWTRQPAGDARIEAVTAPDQWTVEGNLRAIRPMWKYSFPDGQQVYIAGKSGEVVQYTTTGSRLGAWLGAIPHWLYFTPLRAQQKLWLNVIIWSSGVGTVMALFGLIAGVLMYSPSGKYRLKGVRTTVPYAGQKRLHMIFGLFFGIVTCTWAFSGMLSVDPFEINRRSAGGRGVANPAARVQAALRAGRFDISLYDAKPPKEALMETRSSSVKQLDFTSFDGQPVYMASLGARETKIVPVNGGPKAQFDPDRIFQMVTAAALPDAVTEKRLLTQYDAWYIDRHGQRPLPVLFVRLNDREHSLFYIDQRTGSVVGQHSDSSSFVTRWLYHGLHSFDFPWLYNHRPVWDIVVLTLMFGGLAVCVTSVTIGWRVLRRKFHLRAAWPALQRTASLGFTRYFS